MFVTATICDKFLVLHKKFGPAQNIFGPVKGQGINLHKAELLQLGIFFPHPFICMRNFIAKKV